MPYKQKGLSWHCYSFKKVHDIITIQNIYMVSREQNYLSRMIILGPDRNCRFLCQKINYIFFLHIDPDKNYFTQSGLPVFSPFYQCYLTMRIASTSWCPLMCSLFHWIFVSLIRDLVACIILNCFLMGAVPWLKTTVASPSSIAMKNVVAAGSCK